MKTLIELKNIEVSYHKKVALAGVNLEVKASDFIGIIGPNGGGKTTLVKTILGLVKPNSGSVHRYLKRSEIAYLPQVKRVDEKFPISVQEVVSSGLVNGPRMGVKLSEKHRKLLNETLQTVGMTELRERAIGELSGGEFQRAMLARAIISSPRLLVLDEPDTHVDNRFEAELYELLKELNSFMAILLVSHDLGIVSSYVKTIACVNQDLHYHADSAISEEQLKVYNCPIEMVTHGPVPHRVIKTHEHG